MRLFHYDVDTVTYRYNIIHIRESVVDDTIQNGADEVFLEIEPVIDAYSACIFAYGQTGAGRTFTMVIISGNISLISLLLSSIYFRNQKGLPGIVPK